MDPLIIVIGTAAIGAISYYAYRAISSIQPYLYWNAKVQARSSTLIKASDLRDRLRKNSIQELLTLTEKTDYREFISDAKTAYDLQKGAEEYYMSFLSSLSNKLPASFAKVLKSYSLIYESRIVKQFYRAWYFNRTPPSPEDIPVCLNLSRANLTSLQDAKTESDFEVILADTPYGNVFQKKHETLESFENAIDIHAFRTARKVLDRANFPGKKEISALIQFRLRHKIEMAVLRNLMIRNSNKSVKTLIDSLPPELTSDNWRQLNNTKDFIHLIAPTPEIKKDMLHHNFTSWECDHRSTYRKLLKDAERRQLQGPVPIFAYLKFRLMELEDIILAASYIEGNVPESIMEVILS